MESSHGDVHVNPIATIDDDDVDDAATGPVGASPSLHSLLERVLETQSSHHTMWETFMMTQAAHEQLLDSLIPDIATLRVDFSKYRSSFLPPCPSDD